MICLFSWITSLISIHLSWGFEFRGVAKVGELMNFEAGMDIMDLLYEKEETSMLYTNPRSLAASILACLQNRILVLVNVANFGLLFSNFIFYVVLQVASYIITVPKQMLEFPVLPWGKISSFLTPFFRDVLC